MKLPIPILLYLVALGLLAWSGWTVYRKWPTWRNEVLNQAHKDGSDQASRGMTQGRAQNPDVSNWNYATSWWTGLKLVNLIGKAPPPPPTAKAEAETEKPLPAIDLRPLDEVIELIALVCDGDGKGADSHVIVRFKPEVNVEAPEWWLRENQPAPAAAAGVRAGPGDAAPKLPAGRPANGAPTTVPVGKPQPGGRPPMPAASSTGLPPFVQKIWVDGGADVRRSPLLWPIKSTDGRVLGNVRLVRVAADAQSAFFSRELPPPRAGEPAPPPKEEELLKTEMGLDQNVLRELRKLQGRAPVAGGSGERRGPANAAGDGVWIEGEETRLVGNVRQIGRSDERMFQENPDRLMQQVTMGTYQKGSVRGLIVRSADTQLAQRFGVTAGDVLIEVNGRKVESQAQAVQQGKSDYRRGVRTWVTKWMSNGQVVERTYQAPDR